MLKVVKGNNVILENDIYRHLLNYKNVIIDLGTGDGRFVYYSAKSNPDTFYIGIDNVLDNLIKYARKSQQRQSKGGLLNVLYLIGAVEDLPDELSGIADKIFITLPWGSLLEGVVKGNHNFLSNIVKIAKKYANFEFCFTYNVFKEANEIEKRNLPVISIDYLETELKMIYSEFKLKIEEINILSEKELRSYQTTWAKKLGYGMLREIYVIKGTIDYR